MRPTLSKEAYAVLLLHAARYPHCAVGGVLLGAVEEREARVRRAIPCFHHALTGPAVETAMAVIESHAEEEGNEVVGCYYAPAGERDASVPAPYAKFMERIVTSRAGNVALLLSGELLAKKGSAPLQALRREGDKFVVDHGSAVAVDEGGVEAADALCCEGGTDEVVDWDQHLEDPAADWRNPKLLAQLK